MISKNLLKELAAYRQAKRLDEEGLFVVEGPKLCAEAVAAGAKVRVVCALEGCAPQAEGAEAYTIGPTELERLSLLRTPNKVWMLVERQLPPVPAGGNLVLALDRLQDPGNLGTIMRTADWYGVRHIVCSADTVSCFNPKVVQATMGAIFRTRVDYCDLPAWLASCGRPVYAATLGGTPLPQVAAPQGAAVLLVGNEGRGISPEAMACATHSVLIPNIGGTAESLNAAVAAGILMHHFCTNLK